MLISEAEVLDFESMVEKEFGVVSVYELLFEAKLLFEGLCCAFPPVLKFGSGSGADKVRRRVRSPKVRINEKRSALEMTGMMPCGASATLSCGALLSVEEVRSCVQVAEN